MRRPWHLAENPNETLIKQILKSRNIDESILNRTINDLPDEHLLANIDFVAERIQTALYNNEPIVIFGHDDPDGITSTYILYRYFEFLGYQKHHYYIPNRNLEQHGIQKSLVEFVRNGGYKFVITVDNGISDYDGVQALNELGCEVIITDHHLIQPDSIPDALAIINPQLDNCQYPYKMLAGVGVVLMLIRYLSKILEHPVDPALYFWTAVGSIADKVPMTGANWLIVRHVIDNWETIDDYSINFLKTNYPRIHTTTDKVNFLQYCCRLIANGREQGGQHKAMKFLLQRSTDKAKQYMLLEEEKNKWELELNEVFRYLDAMMDDFKGNVFIYYDEKDIIPYNLLGTAATYTVNNLDIPAIFMKNKNSMIACEGRSNQYLNMVEAFTYCKEYLQQFGGHAKAAGFTMLHSNYDSFIGRFQEFIQTKLNHLKEIRHLNIDAEIECLKFNPELWSDIESLLPFGQENPEPTIYLRSCIPNQLMSRFGLDSGNQDIDTEKQMDIIVQWKNPCLLRVLDFQTDNRILSFNQERTIREN